MSSLTEISVYTRKIIIWLVVAAIGFFILQAVVEIGIKMFFSKPSQEIAPPNMRFDKLPTPVFSSTAFSSSGLKFTLLNVEGKPPEATSAAKIFSMPKKLPSLLTSQKAKTFAKKLGFTSDPTIVSTTYYRFYDPKDRTKTLELDIVDLNFKLKYDYQKHPDWFSSFPFILRDKAISEVQSFVKSKNLFDDTIFNGQITTKPLRYDLKQKTFEVATSLSTAHAIRIDYFRPDLDNLKLVPPEFNKSYIYAIYSPIKEIKEAIVELEYSFWPIDTANFGTYPLRNSLEAWQDLVEGRATVVNLGKNKQDSNIIIRDIYLAYYDSSQPQVFLQPIFVFEGDNDFIAYLPAVAPNWLE